MALGDYIVRLKQHTTSTDTEHFKKHVHDFGGKVKDEFSLVKSFLVSFPTEIGPERFEKFSKHPAVEAVEKDKEVHASSAPTASATAP